MKCTKININLEDYEGNEHAYNHYKRELKPLIEKNLVYVGIDYEHESMSFHSVVSFEFCGDVLNYTQRQFIDAAQQELALLNESTGIGLKVIEKHVDIRGTDTYAYLHLMLDTDCFPPPPPPQPKTTEREDDLARLMQRNTCLTILTTTMNYCEDPVREISKLRREYVATLIKHDLLYHFDDHPTGVYWDCDEPNENELAMLASLTNYLYDEELFNIANELLGEWY